MENLLTVRFRCSDTDAAQWETILKGLTLLELGATLQDRFDYFGTAAADKLEEMLEAYEPDYWSCEWYRRVEGGIAFQLNSGQEAASFAEALQELLTLSRANDIEVRQWHDDGE